MAYEEVKFGGDTLSWEQGMVVEGKLDTIKEEIGTNKSTVYVINGVQYWGTKVLDAIMQNVKIGDKIKITCTDNDHTFPNGRHGRNFKVEVDK